MVSALTADMTDITTPGLNRAQFLRRGAAGSLALVTGGSIVATMTGPAFAATDSGLDDVTIAQTAAAAELLAVNAYGTAIRSKLFKGPSLTYLRAARKNEQDHYKGLADTLKSLGQSVPVASDFKYEYPRFRNATDIVRFARTLETAFVGAYLQAVQELDNNDLKVIAAQIAVNEGSHLGFFNGVLNPGKGVTASFPKQVALPDVVKAVKTYQKDA